MGMEDVVMAYLKVFQVRIEYEAGVLTNKFLHFVP